MTLVPRNHAQLEDEANIELRHWGCGVEEGQRALPLPGDRVLTKPHLRLEPPTMRSYALAVVEL